MVPTVKEAGRSIHLIPPEGVVIGKPKEGSITQVTYNSDFFLLVVVENLTNEFKYGKILKVRHFHWHVYIILDLD